MEDNKKDQINYEFYTRLNKEQKRFVFAEFVSVLLVVIFCILVGLLYYYGYKASYVIFALTVILFAAITAITIKREQDLKQHLTQAKETAAQDLSDSQPNTESI